MPYQYSFPPRRLAGDFQRSGFLVPASSTPGGRLLATAPVVTAPATAAGKLSGAYVRSQYARPPVMSGVLDDVSSFAEQNKFLIGAALVGLFLLSRKKGGLF